MARKHLEINHVRGFRGIGTSWYSPTLVDLALGDEQRELVASFANLLSRASSPDAVRAAEPAGFDPALWRTLLETGVLTMAVPETAGGWGAGLLELALVAEEVGRALAPAPVVETQVAARLLAASGSGPAAEALAAALAGDRLVTIALHRPRSRVAELVPGGAICDALVLPQAGRLVLAPTPAERRHPVANLASAPLADVDVGGDGGVELAAGDTADALFEAALDEWLVLIAAALVGMATVAHEATCAYAAERRAFGALIGSYQGVAHPLADDATALDGARLLVHEAAWALDAGHRRGRELASMAFAFTSEAAARATYDAVHFHGGYGFMLEHDVQLHYRRARGWARVWGGAEEGYRRAAAARYGPLANRQGGEGLVAKASG
jgi:alkylation response protein AidB-like acyl-CoA dehydrogenase